MADAGAKGPGPASRGGEHVKPGGRRVDEPDMNARFPTRLSLLRATVRTAWAAGRRRLPPDGRKPAGADGQEGACAGGADDPFTPERDYSQAIVRALQDGLLVIDSDGVVRDANRRVSEITGVPRAERSAGPCRATGEGTRRSSRAARAGACGCRCRRRR